MEAENVYCPQDLESQNYFEWNGKKMVKFLLSTPWSRIEGAEV